MSDIGHYLFSKIANLDETSIPFGYLDGRIYNTIGLKTIWVKTAKSSWYKRQAPLILIVYADGIPRVKPKTIFHATTGKKLTNKGHLYNPCVAVEFNKTVYNNKVIFMQKIERKITPAFGDRPSLFALVAAGFHKTRGVLDLLSKYNIMPPMIPGGSTGLVQPLDILINHPLKEILWEEVEDYIDKQEKGKTSWTVGDRRVMTTIRVARAWEKFYSEKRHLIQQVFCNVGLVLPVDGSRDSELNIKEFTSRDLEIGDWAEDYNTSVQEEHRSLDEIDDDSEAVDFVT